MPLRWPPQLPSLSEFDTRQSPSHSTLQFEKIFEPEIIMRDP